MKSVSGNSLLILAWLPAFFFAAFSLIHAQRIVFDVDLSKGKPACVKDTGGVWDEKGWLVTDIRDRLLFDAGYEIKNGYFETTVTMNKGSLPQPSKSKKRLIKRPGL